MAEYIFVLGHQHFVYKASINLQSTNQLTKHQSTYEPSINLQSIGQLAKSTDCDYDRLFASSSQLLTIN
ncbi:hypothetical protein BCV19_22750 [Vibrio splendidus]|uniref:Uncharacterized protein n=1 Tax=Vibrio splendidus TaxID=29497 RepID=A0A2N7CJJ0_VIBSP|nr:hypothetical protein BCV19_22750 [Vibrio splendidus]